MKKLFSLLLALLLVFACSSNCFAMFTTATNPSESLNNPELPRVVDYADLLTDEEEQELSSLISTIYSQYGQDILIVTDNDHGDFSSDEEFIEAFWDYNGFGIGEDSHGWAIFICMGCRSWWQSACGSTREYCTYDTINIIDDFMQIYLLEANYYGAFEEALRQLSDLFEMGAEKYAEETYSPLGPSEPIDDPVYPTPEEDTSVKILQSLIFAVIVGLVVGLVARARAKASMQTIAKAYSASEYAVRGSFNLRWADNVLIGVRESVQPKADNNNNHGGGAPQHHGGGSSQHHSSGSSFSPSHSSGGHGGPGGGGGHSHSGGGGRHF